MERDLPKMKKPLLLSLLFLFLLLVPVTAFPQSAQSQVMISHHITGGGSAPVFDAATTSTNVTSFSHTCTGSNRFLLVSISSDAGGGTTWTAATYNSVSMTLVDTLNNATDGANVRITVYSLIAPASGSNTVAVTRTGPPANFIVIAASFTGVNQTTPLGTSVTGSGTTATQPSVTVTSGASELVYDAIATLNSNADTFTAGSGQTKRASADDAGNVGGATSTEAGAASVVMDWSSPTRYWSSLGVSIKP